jgi:hypothetical protein
VITERDLVQSVTHITGHGFLLKHYNELRGLFGK